MNSLGLHVRLSQKLIAASLSLCFAVVFLPSTARAVTKTDSRKLRIVDIRGFGDAGFVAGSRRFRVPQPFEIEKKLLRLAALRSNDVNFVNIEGTLASHCRKFVAKDYSFVMPPETLVSMARAGFNMFGLANNHARDCLSPAPESEHSAIAQFLQHNLPKAVWHGTAAHAEDLWQRIPILKVKGVRIGFVAIKAWENPATLPVGNLSHWDEILGALQKARVDIRVLSLHGGTEGRTRPDPEMVRLSRDFIGRFDGDIVFAHHAHRIQGFELLQRPNGRLGAVFYSLGNFLHGGLSARGDGMVAQLKVTRRGVLPKSVRVYPLTEESSLPGPASHFDLLRAEQIWFDSNRYVESQALPRQFALRRIPFKMQQVRSPGRGFALVPEVLLEKRHIADRGADGQGPRKP